MSIEELATMLGEQMYEAQARAWDECNERWMARGLTPDFLNPYRKVSA